MGQARRPAAHDDGRQTQNALYMPRERTPLLYSATVPQARPIRVSLAPQNHQVNTKPVPQRQALADSHRAPQARPKVTWPRPARAAAPRPRRGSVGRADTPPRRDHAQRPASGTNTVRCRPVSARQLTSAALSERSATARGCIISPAHCTADKSHRIPGPRASVQRRRRKERYSWSAWSGSSRLRRSPTDPAGTVGAR